MTLAAGTRLGSYEILAPLGAGGMGEVYRARDSKLHREVALKVIPSRVDSDLATLDRFQREARTVAALNHPHIVTIYAVEESDGHLFLAMELVDGHTLADLIPPNGLPIDTLLKHAIPLADALSTAHAHGVTHRDLKPSNVMVTKDGRVKVLDFGLAKLRDPAVQLDGTPGPTQALTGHGHIVGTVAYMSPEQAAAGAVDERSDLFSLGVMIYEMATGTRPFKGDGSVSTLAAILKDTPKPITDVQPHLPRDLSRIVRRALAKDPEQRYQTAKDLRNDLQTLKDDLVSGELSVGQPSIERRVPLRRPIGLLVAVGIVAALAAAIVVFAIARRAARPADTRAAIPPAVTRLTATGKAGLAAISPDGRYVVHVVSQKDGYSLWMRQTATSSNVQILPPGPDRYLGLTFSPDGDYVYFTRFEGRTRSNVYRIPALGGTPQPVIGDVDSAISFSPDGSRFAFLRGFPRTNEVSVVIARTDGGGDQLRRATRAMLTGYPVGTRAAWSPDGRTIAAAVGADAWNGGAATGSARIEGIDVQSGKQRTLVGGRWDSIANLAWISDGSLVVSATEPGKPNNQIWQLTSETATLRRVTNDLNTYPDIATAARAPALVAVLGDLSSTLSITAPGDVTARTTLTTGAGRYDGQTGLAWTPDNRLVFTSAAGGQTDLWVIGSDGRDARQLTADAAVERQPVVTPDGRSVVFVANRNGQSGIWRLDIATGTVTRLTDGETDFMPQCLPDGRSIVFTRVALSPRLFRVALDSGTPTLISDDFAMSTTLSPDGRHLASFSFGADGRQAVVLRAVETGAAQRSFDIVSVPMMLGFTPRGDALTFLESRKGSPSLWNQPVDGGAPQRLLDMNGERIFSFAWSRDGRLAIAHGPVPTDVVLLSGMQ